MKGSVPLFVLLGFLAGLSGCETHPYYGDVRVHDRDYDVRVVFSDHDRGLIRDYYRSYYRGLPPGLAKQGKVPPGHAKKLYRSQPLPPGLEWQYLPADLERRLSPLPDGYARVIVGTDVGIMNVRTRVIMDLIEDLDH
jgi:hypothetical protein